jgi:hypothetical protein
VSFVGNIGFLAEKKGFGKLGIQTRRATDHATARATPLVPASVLDSG